jgi:toxin ParE1/3/4
VAEINWTAEAQRWLKEIHDYIAADNPEAAARTTAAILNRAEILSRFPEVGYATALIGTSAFCYTATTGSRT